MGRSLLEETILDAPVKLLTLTEHATEATPAASPVAIAIEEFKPELSE